jgi:RNA recognition motif-containing protein
MVPRDCDRPGFVPAMPAARIQAFFPGSRIRFARTRARAGPFPESHSMSKIYVGNLPFSANEDAVRQLFAQHGTVDSVALINDRDTGQPRGFGFVEMTQNADAARAIQNLNGYQMDGRSLKVNEAQPKSKSSGPRRW